jgi:hypothetical protein
MKNANYSDTWNDYMWEEHGIQLSRTYNSRSLYAGIFGFGWCSTLESAIRVESAQVLRFVSCGDGLETALRRNGTGGHGEQRFEDNNYVILVGLDGTYAMECQGICACMPGLGVSGMVFDRMGNLIRMTLRDGDSLEVSRDRGLFTAMKDRAGHEIRFEYDTTGRVRKSCYPNGTCSQYEYSLAGNLMTRQKNSWVSSGSGSLPSE